MREDGIRGVTHEMSVVAVDAVFLIVNGTTWEIVRGRAMPPADHIPGVGPVDFCAGESAAIYMPMGSRAIDDGLARWSVLK